MIEETFITPKEAMKVLNISQPTLLKLVKEYKLKRYKAEGLSPRYRETEVRALWSKLYK